MLPPKNVFWMASPRRDDIAPLSVCNPSADVAMVAAWSPFQVGCQPEDVRPCGFQRALTAERNAAAVGGCREGSDAVAVLARILDREWRGHYYLHLLEWIDYADNGRRGDHRSRWQCSTRRRPDHGGTRCRWRLWRHSRGGFDAPPV